MASPSPDLFVPWASDAVQGRVADIQRHTKPGTQADLELAELSIQRHWEQMEEQGVVLYAGSNSSTGSTDHWREAQIGMRPSLGYPGEKQQMGMEHLEVLEVLATRAVAASMRARYSELRLQSATLANLAVYAALTAVGATLAVLPRQAGGHLSHHTGGAPSIRGHVIVDLPWSQAAMDVDVAALPSFLDRTSPSLIVLGGSLMLFPYDMRSISEVAKAAGVPILYDASHVAGLIAGGRFQDPLSEGADVMTFSTYKTYGAPAGGAVVTNSVGLAEKIGSTAYPGLTANFDIGRYLGIMEAATELLKDGEAYADRCISLASVLGAALRQAGCHLLEGPNGFSESHQLALDLGSIDAARRAVADLAATGIFVSAAEVAFEEGITGVLRLGTQELARRRFKREGVGELAVLIARAARTGSASPGLRREVQALRAMYIPNSRRPGSGGR